MKYVLVFDVGESRLALDVKQVSHVLRKPVITPLPGSPDFIEGVLVYKDRVVPILDLAAKLNLPTANGPGRVFLLTVDELLLGFHVDRIRDVIHTGETDPPDSDTGIPLTGILRYDGAPVGVLDPAALLSETDRRILHALQ